MTNGDENCGRRRHHHFRQGGRSRLAPTPFWPGPESRCSPVLLPRPGRHIRIVSRRGGRYRLAGANGCICDHGHRFPSAAIPSWLLALSWVVIAFWALYSLSRVRGRWRRAFAILAVAPFGVLAIAYAADWVAGGVASPAQAECTVPVSDRDLTIEDGEVAIVVDDCRPLPTDQSLPAARGSRLRNLLALAGLAVGLAAVLKPLLWSTVPSFSVGLAIGLLASSLFVRPNSEWLFAADISSLVLTGLVGLAVFVMKAVSVQRS